MSATEALGLYNYWIVVFLMMTGFYIVIARGNLIKSILGLNIFQTSVFLLYITMGKIRGATAPIIPPDVAAMSMANSDSHHGGGHHAGGPHGPVHSDAAHRAGSHVAESHVTESHLAESHLAGSHLAGSHLAGSHLAESADEAHGFASDAAGEIVHSATGYVAMTGIDAEHIVYSNPLPSVLMLTAIVVGIATTSLALALIVRVREDYGTLEEDEIQQIDQEEIERSRSVSNRPEMLKPSPTRLEGLAT